MLRHAGGWMQTEKSKIERMLAHPAFDHVVHRLASGFLEVQQAAPRLASQFSTQQRWLLSHAALSRYFRGLAAGRPGLSRREFVDDALAHRLASRNTAQAFFAESLKYGIVLPTKAVGGTANPLAAPAPAVLWALNEWYLAHLGALDALPFCGLAAGGGALSVLLSTRNRSARPRLRLRAGRQAARRRW